MTLAVLFLFAAWMTSAPAQSGAMGRQPAPPPASAQGPAVQSQSGQGQAQNAPDVPTTTQPQTAKKSPKTTPAKRRRHKKKVASSGCRVSPPTSETAGSNPGTPADPSSGKAAAQAAGTLPPTNDCPPPKIVVRQGGTEEPSIQLAGGPNSGQAPSKRDGVNQLLGATEQNLKKITAQTLNATELETTTQIRQFVDQSKAALADGDLERARTLAWKAKTLSDDLITPQK